jgi:hypothetical protein
VDICRIFASSRSLRKSVGFSYKEEVAGSNPASTTCEKAAFYR